MDQLQKYLFSTFFLCLNSNLCISIDTISQPLRDGDVVVSRGESFALGFFSPGNSARRFVGIWYNKVSERTVVWVANRDNPINDTSGILTHDSRGGLVLYENNQTSVPVWFANTTSSVANTTSSVAQLLDSGNLVLIDRKNGDKILWQSFDYPTDTYLPAMKIGIDRKTGSNWSLTSWKSKDDPGTGTVSCSIDPTGFPQFFLYKGSARIWRAGPWTGRRWSGIPAMTARRIFNTTFVNTKDEVWVTYSLLDSSIFSRMTVNESGTVQRSTWVSRDSVWNEFWSVPNEYCDYYGRCGANSNCDTYNSDAFTCKCLPGFEPKSPSDWFLRDVLGGCVRKAGVSTCRNGEGFVRLRNAKLPDTSMANADMNASLKMCEEQCLKNCSCMAYASADERGIGCLTWFGDLIDTRIYSSVGQDLYVRVDVAELAKYENRKGPLAKGVKAILVIVSLILLALFMHCLIKKRRKARARDRRHNKHLFSNVFQNLETRNGNDHDGEMPGLSFFHLSDIVQATNNFSFCNELGEGGFGSVYKGVLQDGKEIAVKRLSKRSAQGNEEFKNEVALISKLQHRNLVKMLGYCLNDQEKMLIYEFLPNKSLDTFIFDQAKGAVLNWPMRHEIICGIARGILYLHQDSRLKIIHRDLKASNILLDASMKPKISDFGMARIFEGDQNDAETRRVVGTYGYMSPEYAMQGLFSVKSDVYSFGVLLIEIITGRRNSSFYYESTSTNLIGYVWELWEEGRSLEMVDISLRESYAKQEVERCIQIGLLCVQESAADRPTMSNVVFMLTNNTILASPKQPVFIIKRTYNSEDPSTTSGGGTIISTNEMTSSVLHPR